MESMGWFTRKDKNIVTPTKEKKEAPDGLWHRTPSGIIASKDDLEKSLWVCSEDDYHFRIGSEEYFSIIFDKGAYEELDASMQSKDPLKFKDKKEYKDRIKAAQKKTGLKDAVRTGYGKVMGRSLVVACMDFTFIGGSMGSVVGEKIARAIDHAIAKKAAFMMVSKSGGARMMEAGFSLMQMAKTTAKLTLLAQHKLPYISLLTDPTTGGVTASFAMLGDINMAEPGALIGFAGPRIVRETIGKDLPEDFQTAEFLLEHGFLDFIVDRRELKTKLDLLLQVFEK